MFFNRHVFARKFVLHFLSYCRFQQVGGIPARKLLCHSLLRATNIRKQNSFRYLVMALEQQEA